MRKLLYILLGLVLVGGAVGAFGVRQFGWEPPGMSQRGDGSAARSASRGGDRHWHSERRGDRGDRGGSWFNFANMLDILNAIVGIIGIGLTISGMRMQRNAMQMTMRGRD